MGKRVKNNTALVIGWITLLGFMTGCPSGSVKQEPKVSTVPPYALATPSNSTIACQLTYNSYQLSQECELKKAVQPPAATSPCDPGKVCPATPANTSPPSVCGNLYSEACTKIPPLDNSCLVTPSGNEDSLDSRGPAKKDYLAYETELITKTEELCKNTPVDSQEKLMETCKTLLSCKGSPGSPCRKAATFRALSDFAEASVSDIEDKTEKTNFLKWINLKKSFAQKTVALVYGTGDGVTEFQRTQRAFDEAKTGMQRAINEMPGLSAEKRKDMIAALQATRFSNPNDYVSDFMNNSIDVNCITGGMAGNQTARQIFSQSTNQTAYNAGDPTLRSRVVTCGGNLLAKRPFLNMVWTLSHELAHSFDPCKQEIRGNIGKALKIPFCQEGERKYPVKGGDPAYSKLLACFSSKTGYRGHTADFSRLSDQQIDEDGKDRLNCLQTHFPHCNHEARWLKEETSIPSSSYQQDQANELFADHMAGYALSQVIKNKTNCGPGEPQLTSPVDIQNTILNVAAERCRGDRNQFCNGSQLRDDHRTASTLETSSIAHPTGFVRVNSVLGTNPELRRLMGCPADSASLSVTMPQGTENIPRSHCTF